VLEVQPDSRYLDAWTIPFFIGGMDASVGSLHRGIIFLNRIYSMGVSDREVDSPILNFYFELILVFNKGLEIYEY
jgi:hypothetical protein